MYLRTGYAVVTDKIGKQRMLLTDDQRRCLGVASKVRVTELALLVVFLRYVPLAPDRSFLWSSLSLFIDLD
ncbi:MAG: hypothetical protein ACR2N1_03030 [Rubripirellula sp.]